MPAPYIVGFVVHAATDAEEYDALGTLMKYVVRVVECFHRLLLNRRALCLFNFDMRL